MNRTSDISAINQFIQCFKAWRVIGMETYLQKI